MDSKVVQSQVNENDEHQQSPNAASQQVVHGVEEHHSDHERKSVLIMNKVKAKAKKIKDTIKKHGQNVFDHGQYNNEDQHAPDENEEMNEDHEVHEAPIHESDAVKSASPTSEQVENLGKSGVNFESTTAKGEEEPHHEPRATTEVNLNKNTDTAKPFVEEEKPEQPEQNLERSTGLEEDSHKKGSRPEAYTPPNYQTEIADPTGTGTAETDITPDEKSFAKMNVQDEPKPSIESDALSNVAETHYPFSESHNQSVQDHSFEKSFAKMNIQDKPKPSMEHEALPDVAETQYPSAGSHNQFVSDHSFEDPFTKMNVQDKPKTSTEPEALANVAETQHLSAENHDQHMPELPSATKTQYPSAGSHDQIVPQPDLSTGATTQYPPDGSRDQIAPETILTSTDTKPEIPEITGQTFNTATTTAEEQHPSSAATTQYPSDGSHDQISSETIHTSTNIKPQISEVTGRTSNTTPTTVEEQHSSNAATTQYPSDGSHDQISSETIHTSNNTKPQISELTGQTSNTTPTTVEEQHPSAAATTQYPSAESHDQIAAETVHTSTNTCPEISEVTEQTFNTNTTKVEEQPSHESVEKSSNKTSYTDKISSATSGIADKAASAKNAVASKPGYGEKGERDNMATPLEEQKSEDVANKSGSTTESGKNIAQSLTEKLAPVYWKAADVGSAVKSKVCGTRTVDNTGVGIEADNGVKEQNKGVNVKDYLAEKLRPGEEDKALSEVISEALHKRKEEPKEASEVDDTGLNKQEEEKMEKEHGHLDSRDEKSVTVSEESNVNNPGKGVVVKLKGVVGSWFGKSGENQSSQGGGEFDKNKNSGAELEHASQAEGQTSVQE